MWKNNISKLKRLALDTLFPATCLGCQREGEWFCQDCISTLEIQNWSLCPVCQKRTLDFKVCKNCRGKTKLTGLFTPLSYEKPLVKSAIRQFKYEPFLRELATPLSRVITSHLLLIEFPLQNFVLVPVPLFKSRLRWRGYNQSQELAQEISKIANLPLESQVLVKIKKTKPQIELSLQEREENIKGAFVCADPSKIKGKRILLIDDVYTTGATMEECASKLLESGAKEVWGAVVARG